MARYIWYSWCDTADTTCSTDAWVKWTAGSTSNHVTCADTATSDASTVWVAWTVNGASATCVVGEPYVDPRTPEQIAADEARWAEERRQTAARAAAAAAERAAARDKAQALLHSMLTVQQRTQLQRDLFFEVVSQSQKRYRIRQGTHGNVRLLNDKGEEVCSYCGQPVGVPDEDAMLAQKLQLEYDEAEFLKRANATRLRAA